MGLASRGAAYLEAVAGTFSEDGSRSQRHATEGKRRQRREGALQRSISINKLSNSSRENAYP